MDQQPEVEQNVPIPRAVGQRRRVVVVGLVVTLIAVAVAGWWWSGGQGGDPLVEPEDDRGLLPLAADQVPAENSVLAPIHIGVELNYTNTPELGVSLQAAAQTNDRSTIEFYTPASEEVQQGVLQFLDGEGRVITEEAFAIPSSFVADFVPGSEGQSVAVNDGTLYLVVPLAQRDRIIESVRVLDVTKEIQLDEIHVSVPLSFGAERKGLADSIRHLFGGEAQAQLAPGAGDSVFRILVLSEAGAEGLVAPTVSTIQSMVNAVRPWSELAQRRQVEVVGAPNTASLGCSFEPMPGRSETFPVCRNAAAVYQRASALRPDWDAIVVVTNATCGTCGTSFLGSRIAAVANQPNGYIVAHEMAHAIASLRDEYGYTVAGFQAQPGLGPNCFASGPACSEAMNPYVPRGAQCAAGCERPGEWRPATAIMHSYGAPQFGPYEEDLLRNAILAQVVQPTPTPTPPTPTPLPTVSIPPSATPIPTTIPSPTAQPSDVGRGPNLEVAVRLSTAGPTLRIDGVRRTQALVKRNHYEPASAEQPHSLLQVFAPGADGPVFELPFTLPTEYLGEVPEGAAGPERLPVEESTALLVVPIPELGVREVRIVAPSSGAILDRAFFSVPPLFETPTPTPTGDGGGGGARAYLPLQNIGGGSRIKLRMEIGPQSNQYVYVQSAAMVNELVHGIGGEEGAPAYRLQLGTGSGRSGSVGVKAEYIVPMPISIGQPTARGGVVVEVVAPWPEDGANIVRLLGENGGVLYEGLLTNGISRVESWWGRLAQRWQQGWDFLTSAGGRVAWATPYNNPGNNLRIKLRSISGITSVVGVERTRDPVTGQSEIQPDPGETTNRLEFHSHTKLLSRDAAGNEVYETQLEHSITVPVRGEEIALVIPISQAGLGTFKVFDAAGELIRSVNTFRYPFLPDIPDLPDSGSSTPHPKKTIQPTGSDDEEDGGEFTILITNEVDVSPSALGAVEVAAYDMLQIDPWSQFTDKIRIVVATNDTPLNCRSVNATNGATTYPLCDDQAIIRTVAGQLEPEWDTAIIVNDSNCSCGTVSDFSPFTAVALNASGGLLAHELGHAVAKMVDEYFYQHGGYNPPKTPNCFPTQNACEDALKPFAGQTGGQCSAGCNTGSTWRPATRIMHNTYSLLEFGPYERCLYYNAIGSYVGADADTRCLQENEDDTGDFYWGWRR